MKVAIMITLVTMALISSIPTAKADIDIMEEIKQIDVFRLKKSPLACPMIVVGNSCPEENPLYFFKCCGNAMAECCFRLQDWATVLVFIMIALIIISIIVNLIRCICCY